MRPPLVLQVKHCASGVCYFLDGTWPAKCPLCGVPWPSRPFESIQTELTAMESMNDGETAVIYSTEESSNSSQQKEISTSSAYSFNSIGSSSTDFTGSSVDSNSSNITTLSYSTNATLSLKTLDWKGVIFKALVSPLVSSESAPKSVLVKTTYGTFLNNYSETALLHVGLSSSTGQMVYNFDERGCFVDSAGWEQCIAVQLPGLDLTDSEWDEQLENHYLKITNNAKWKYNALQLNCYDYILDFLNGHVGFLKQNPLDKSQFVEQFISGPLSLGVAFLRIIKEIQSTGFKSLPSKTANKACDVCNRKYLDKSDVAQCLECEDYDLCFTCYKSRRVSDKHTSSHEMMLPSSFLNK